MNIVEILGTTWDWCSKCGVQKTFHLIKEILNILRIIVPIALIAMTSIDVAKKVINPDDKDGQKKIMYRAIAALIVFLIPTVIKLVFKIIDIGRGVNGSYDESESSLSACWR